MQQNKSIMASCLLALGALWACASGQQTSDPLDTCYQLTDVAARVACYDHEVQRRHAAASAAPTAPSVSIAPAGPAAPAATTGVPHLAPAPPSAADDTIGLDGKQLIIKRKEEGIQPVAVKPFVATLSRLQLRPGHQYYFELDNGQVWESTDGEPDLFLGAHETVTIRPGVFGAFFLKTQEGNSIRVHRLR